jgi:hypothetical protein
LKTKSFDQKKKKKKRTSGLLADLGVENRCFAHVSGVCAMTARERTVGNEKEDVAEGAKTSKDLALARAHAHTHTLQQRASTGAPSLRV